MGLGRPLGDVQPPADLGIGQAVGNERGNLHLPLGEAHRSRPTQAGKAEKATHRTNHGLRISEGRQMRPPVERDKGGRGYAVGQRLPLCDGSCPVTAPVQHQGWCENLR